MRVFTSLLIIALLKSAAAAAFAKTRWSNLQAATSGANVMIVTMGSRGDIVPMVNLCNTLRPQVKSCSVVTQAAHRDLVETQRHRFLPLTDPKNEVEENIALASFHGFASLPALRWMRSNDFRQRFNANYKVLVDHVENTKPDIVLMNPWVFTQSLIRAKFHIPVITINPFPWKPLEGVPSFAESTYDLISDNAPTRIYNATVRIHNRMSKFVMKDYVRKLLQPLCSELNMTSSAMTYDMFDGPHIYGYSRHLMNRNFTKPSQTYVTGSWAQTPASLQVAAPSTQTAAGEQWARMEPFIKQNQDKNKIIFVGFGSMEYSTEFWATVINRLNDILTAFPNLAIIYQGPNNGRSGVSLTQVPRAVRKEQANNSTEALMRNFENNEIWSHPRLFRMNGPMPHGLFMPYIDAFVTHGGAGSIATATSFGVPMIVKPFFGDQFVWCNEIAQKNWGACLSRRFKKNEFFASLQTVFDDKEMRGNVRTLHSMIKKEDGLQNFKFALGDILKSWLSGSDAQRDENQARTRSLSKLQAALLPATALMVPAANAIFPTSSS